MTRFTFGHGVQFSSPKATDAIVPALLKRVWEVDNDKMKVLFEIGTNGAVSGDSFIKIAYEEPWQDSIGRVHPGRVRILPLNAAYCFPEYHPHDRKRLLRMKIKYRFYGTSPQGTRSVYTYCVDDKTQALTRDGWKFHWELSEDDEVYAYDPHTREARWEPVNSVERFDWDGPLTRYKSKKVDALTTPNHRWMVESRDGSKIGWTTTENLTGSAIKAVHGGGTPTSFSDAPKMDDEFAELIAWTVTEGHYQPRGNGVIITQSESHNPAYVERIRAIAEHFRNRGATVTETRDSQRPEMVRWYFGAGVASDVRAAAPDKQLTMEFLTSLTLEQANLVFETLIDADGHRKPSTLADGSVSHTVSFVQQDEGRANGFQTLAAMLGKRTHARWNKASSCWYITVYKHDTTWMHCVDSYEEHYQGIVWCPTVSTKTFMARRNGTVYWTGNTEILTDDVIEEYVNDELISSRPNPVGVIPVVHIPNIPVPSSPWGLSDCQDIINLNLHYNEVSTDIADIVNYHAAPVTVIVGAKANQLEKGAKKVWGGLPKDASVFNLEGGGSGLQGAMQYLESIKRAMHEMVGIPETALGQMQPISNTSGVALSIQFQPLMNRWNQKVAQYGDGLQAINEIILLTLAAKEPQALQWDPALQGNLEEGQVPVLDPADPTTYITTVHFPPPLPLDKLVLLNEIQMLSQMGLESREGALRTLGEEFPEEKLEEIRQELIDDAVADGALDMIRTQVQKEIMDLTGMMPGIEGGPATPIDPTMAQTPSGEFLGDGVPGPMGSAPDNPLLTARTGEMGIRDRLVTRAYGTKIPQNRKPDEQRNDH